MLILVFILFLIVIMTCNSHFTPEMIPNPHFNLVDCGRGDILGSSSTICDPSLILETKGKNIIEGYINTLANAKNIQIGMLVINQMDSTYIGRSTIEKASERFARSVHDTWGIGDIQTQKGILVFLSINDRAVFISTGKGIENIINSEVIKVLIDHIKPLLKNHEFSLALELCIIDIICIVDKDLCSQFDSINSKLQAHMDENESNDLMQFVIFGAFVLFVGLFAFMSNRHKRNLEKGNKSLVNLITELEDAKDRNVFISKSCPICLDDFPENTIVKDSLPIDEINKTTESNSSENEASLLSKGSCKEELSQNKVMKSSHRPMTLVCGHVFCFQCLELHLKSSSGRKCPICRASVDRDDNHSNHQPSSTITTNNFDETSCHFVNDISSGIQQATNAWDSRRVEFQFRVHRMNNLFPNVMTNELSASVARSIEGNALGIHAIRILQQRRTEVHRLINETESRERMQSQGSRGSSFKFSGGRSSSGGGGTF